MESSRLSVRSVARGFGVTVRSAPVPILLSWIVPGVRALSAPLIFATTGSIVARLSAHDGDVTRHVALIAVVLVGGELLSPLEDVLYGIAGYQTFSRLGVRLMRAVGGLPGVGHFDDPALADNLAAARYMLGSGAWILVGTMQSQVSLLIGLFSLSFVAARVAPWAPLVILATVVPACVSQWRARGEDFSVLAASLPVARMSSYVRGLATDVRAAKESRIFGLADWLVERQHRLWLETTTPRWAARRRAMRRAMAIGALRMAAMAVPFAYAFARLAAGSLSPGAFTAGALALAAMTAQVRWLSGTASLRDGFAYLARYVHLLDLAAAEPRLRVRGTEQPPTVPREGLRLEAVTFRYPGRDAPVLDSLDLWIPAGRSIALVGVNGAGKSTLVKLLCRLHDPQSGRIALDGVDVADFDLAAYRDRIAVVFQDFMRLPTTARDNVGVGCVDRMDDDPLLWDAATRAGAASVIEDLPHGWDSTLSRVFGGVELSEGQWQRLALARALVTVEGRASVLILDEPTAAMDVRVEQELYRHFRDLSRGRTTVLISHRLSTVRMADEIALLEHGRIVERGTHDELVTAGGAYAELWELQSARFRADGRLG